MSLVHLKNLLINVFYKKSVIGASSRNEATQDHEPLLQAGRSRSIGSDTTAHDGSVDLESQLPEKSGCLQGFKVDARIISDATIGLSDGLTVPFALTAGLSALGNTKVVIYGGLAELIAGMISMGLGGYLGALSEAASYDAERLRTRAQVDTDRRTVLANISNLFKPYNVPQDIVEGLTEHLGKSEPDNLVDFVMKFDHCAEEPSASRPWISGATIGLGYFLGGLVPLVPYFFVGNKQVFEGLYISIGVMVIALFIFGYVKTCVVKGWQGGRKICAGCWGGFQLVCIGGLAAASAMALVKLFDHISSV